MTAPTPYSGPGTCKCPRGACGCDHEATEAGCTCGVGDGYWAAHSDQCATMRPAPAGPEPEVRRTCDALCRNVEADRDAAVRVAAERLLEAHAAQRERDKARADVARLETDLAHWTSGRRRKGILTVESVPDGLHYAAELVRAQGTEGGERHDQLLREAGMRLKALTDASGSLLAEAVVLRADVARLEGERDEAFAQGVDEGSAGGWWDAAIGLDTNVLARARVWEAPDVEIAALERAVNFLKETEHSAEGYRKFREAIAREAAKTAEAERDAMRPVVEAAVAFRQATAKPTATMAEATERAHALRPVRAALFAAVDQMGARTDHAEPQSDESGPGVAQDVPEAPGAQKGAQGADDRPPVVWRHPCGWGQVSPIPRRCPSCGGDKAWGGRRD